MLSICLRFRYGRTNRSRNKTIWIDKKKISTNWTHKNNFTILLNLLGKTWYCVNRLLSGDRWTERKENVIAKQLTSVNGCYSEYFFCSFPYLLRYFLSMIDWNSKYVYYHWSFLSGRGRTYWTFNYSLLCWISIRRILDKSNSNESLLCNQSLKRY